MVRDIDRPDIMSVDKGPELVSAIKEIESRDTYEDKVEGYSFLLSSGHEGCSGYVNFGNNKVAKSVAIMNPFGSATDCPHLGEKECQVTKSSDVDDNDVTACYAKKDEENWPYSLAFRRRQEYLWDCLDADTFAKAFLKMIDRKRTPVDAFRVSESGDFRHRGDIIKLDRVAEVLAENGIQTYTYSASSELDWSYRQHFTLNASNEFFPEDAPDRRFGVLYDTDDIELNDGAVWCPFDHATAKGETGDKRPKCGECRLCINPEGPNVSVRLH